MKHLIFVFLFLFLFLFILSSCGSEDNSNISLNNSKIILALGDSLTIGYGLDVSNSYPSQLGKILNDNGYSYKIVNGGVSGNTSEQLLDRLSDFDKVKADIYLINIGANDGLRRLNIDDMQKNIEGIISHIKKINPNGKIILFGTELPINFGLHYSHDFKSRFKDIADSSDVSYFGFFLDGVQGNQKLNLSDRLHPNIDGYNIISNNIFNYLVKNKFLVK